MLNQQSRGLIISFEAQKALQLVGANLKTARLRRGESESLAAQRIGVSRSTWRKLEAGEPAVSIGVLFEALSIYGFAEALFYLADPDDDAEGKVQDAARRPRRGSSRW